MALTPPDTGDLAEFMGVSERDLDARADMMLQQATDLMEMATGLEAYPAALVGRVMLNGIKDMAWALLVGLENRAEQFSPFSSERIGSYSYQKAAAAVIQGEATGVPLFDMAIASVVKAAGGVASVTSEHVFDPLGYKQAEIEALELVWTEGNL